MHRIFILVALISIFGFMGCKNIVENYDKRLHKSFLRKDFKGQTLELENHEIFYYDNKREYAPVLLFIHGFGGDGKLAWQEQINAFKNDYRVIIPDILWFGKSKSKGTPELETQIDAINELVKFLKVDQIHLVGISYGGFIGLGVAQSNKKIATLTIVDSPGIYFSEEESQAFCDKIGVDDIADAFIPQNRDEVKRMFDFAFRKLPKLPGFIREQTIGIYMSKNPEKQRKLLNNLPDNRKQFQDLKVHKPVLILWGEDDEIFLIRDAKQLQEQLAAELIIIPKAGHGLPYEQPKAFNKALMNFVEGVEK